MSWSFFTTVCGNRHDCERCRMALFVMGQAMLAWKRMKGPTLMVIS